MTTVPPASMGAFLYVPGDRADLIVSARRRDVDAFILDLEDAVAPSRKELALDQVLAALAAGFPAPVWVRVNGPEVGPVEAAALAGTGRLAGLWLPKVEDLDQIEAVSAVITPDVRIGLMIESAAGLFAAQDLARHPHVAVLHIGEVDLAADLRVDATAAGVMDPYRSVVVAAGAAAGLAAPLGPVWADLTDWDGFLASTSRLAAQGFGGRACIHPDQVSVVRETFAPSREELAAARVLLERHERRQSEGVGVYRGDDGAMIDEAVVRRARGLVQRAGE